MIFFDIDQTLINHQQAQDTAALLFLQQFSSLLPYGSEDFCQCWQAVMEKHFASFMGGEITFYEHRRRRMRELFQKSESYLADDEADKRFAIYLQHYENNWTLFDDVLPCLNALSNCRLGTNTKVCITSMGYHVQLIWRSGGMYLRWQEQGSRWS